MLELEPVALKPPSYIAAGSTAAIVVIRHAHEKARDKKFDDSILNLAKKAS
jgi:hypothetical protein